MAAMGMIGYFDITVSETESMVEPDGVLDDLGWELVEFVGIHRRSLAEWQFI